MNKVLKLFAAVMLLVTPNFACSLTAQTPASNPSAAETESTQGQYELPPTPISSECQVDKWNIFPTNLKQIPLGDGSKLVAVQLAVQNNSRRWGSISGPSNNGLIINEDTSQDIILTTNDGSSFNALSSGYFDLPSGQFIFPGQDNYMPTDWTETPTIPPDFTVIGGETTLDGSWPGYIFSFQVPESVTPVRLTLKGMTATCILPPTKMQNGKYEYWGSRGGIPTRTYALPTDVSGVIKEPRSGSYPGLVGGKVVMADNVGFIMFTNLSRNGNVVSVKYSYTDQDTIAASLSSGSLNAYVIGDSGIAFPPDQTPDAADVTIAPGQTASGFTVTFTVPASEKNLALAYVAGDVIAVDDVFSIK